MLRYRLPILRKNVKMSLLMKNARLFTILIVLIALLSLTSAVTPAFAADGTSRDVYQGKNYSLQTIRESETKKIAGVYYSGKYFGASGIEVAVSVYSDENLTIDFPINESDEQLSFAQQVTRAKLLQLAEDIDNYIHGIDLSVNAQNSGQDGQVSSYVYRYNMAGYGDKVEVDEDTYNILQIARTMYEATNGAFNPAVYRLVDLWGFSSRTYHKNGNLPYDRQWTGNSYPLPDEDFVKAFSNPAFTDFSNTAVTLTQEDGKYYVTKNVQAVTVDGAAYDQWLDLGGIAKGYVVDGVKEMLSQTAITRFFVDAGTSSQAYGKNYDGGDFTLLTRDPYKTDYWPQPTVAGARLSDATVSTSGQYERKFVTNGVEYAHIIDGTQGRPAQTGVNSITIIAPQNYLASMGDCLTTALTVMGRDRVVDFMNGYLKDNGIKVLLTYETVDGGKQLLSNYDKSDIVKGDTFDEYAWSVGINGEGKFFYDVSAKAPVEAHNLNWLIITLGVAVILAIVVVVVMYFVKGGKSKVASNVLNAKKDNPVKVGDVGVYLFVVILIIALFIAFFGGESEQIRAIQMVDFSNSNEGELLFAYNVARNEWVVYSDNEAGWTIEVAEDGNDINVTFRREVDGKQQYNIMTITRGSNVSVKMIEATCDDMTCVYNFPKLTNANRAIACSPHRLKIITQ